MVRVYIKLIPLWVAARLIQLGEHFKNYVVGLLEEQVAFKLSIEEAEERLMQIIQVIHGSSIILNP